MIYKEIEKRAYESIPNPKAFEFRTKQHFGW